MSTTYYHGAHGQGAYSWEPHQGLCLTDDYDAARHYAGERGTVYVITVPDDLTVLDSDDGYDHEANSCRWDDLCELEDCGHDIVSYQDEDEWGHQHTTWRIASERAVEMISYQAAI